MAHVAAGSGPGSGPGPSVAAARCAAAISGPGPDPGPDPAATCATARLFHLHWGQPWGPLEAEGRPTWLSKTWLSKIDTVDWQNPTPVPGLGPGSGPEPEMEAAQRIYVMFSSI